MLVILICIHRLQRGRHKLFSDLFSNDSQIHIYSIQTYGTIVISVLFSFFLSYTIPHKDMWVIQCFEQTPDKTFSL